jgi:ubiquinone/menaquinone biosynthesis C-methylase UbiE
VDGYDDGQLVGWAWDPNDSARRISVDVVVDGQLESRITANIFRSDLVKAGIGDGRYAFTVPLGDLEDRAELVDVRFADTGKRLAHSPVSLTETLWAHRRRLSNLLKGGPFSLSDFRFDGSHFEVSGVYLPTHGDVSRVELDLDGLAPVELAWDPLDEQAKRRFWFLKPATGAFRARFALGGMPASPSGDIRLSIIDPVIPVNPLRFFLIPTCASSYRNLPDAQRQKRVLGWANNARFVFLGRTHHEINRMLAKRYCLGTSKVRRVLDLGVGCGRIARHFLTHDPDVALHGIDIDADNVDWCEKHLPGGQFRRGPLSPPLPYGDRTFEFLHANSVFTHLTEQMQDLWLAEIARVLTPDGRAVVTYHGETAAAYARMPLDWLTRWTEIGIDAIGLNRDLAGFVTNEEYYRNTYHTTEYIRNHWSQFVEILGFHHHVFAYQDAVVIKPRP